MPLQRIALVLLITSFLSACAYGVREPNLTTPINESMFSQNLQLQRSTASVSSVVSALTCMDTMLAANETPQILLSLDMQDGPIDYAAGWENVIINTLSTMSLTSNAITYVVQKPISEPNASRAEYFIRMSMQPLYDLAYELKNPRISHVDKNSNATKFWLDMNMGAVENMQILPGIFSSNSITVPEYTYVRFQAMRTLIELGIIELVGKHLKLPFWECLDIPVARTATDYSEPNFGGDDNSYRPYLKLEPNSGNRLTDYQYGDKIQLTLGSSIDIFAYCYYQQYDGAVFQIFPNPYQTDNVLQANQKIEIPGDNRISITADSPGPTENILCIGHKIDLINKLDAALPDPGFEARPYPSLTDILNHHSDIDDTLLYSDIYAIRKN